jgi:hypothetical protein
MRELQLTLDMIPPEEEEEKKVKKQGLFGRFRKEKKAQIQVDDSQDLNLQRAIARSMADQHGKDAEADEPVVYYDTEADQGDLRNNGGKNNRQPIAEEEDDDIAMAKALSMSEAAPMTEEEMIQRAIEESKRDAERQSRVNGAARKVHPYTDFGSPQTEDLLGLNDPLAHKNDPRDDLDRKMPALKQPPPPSSAFDPYSLNGASKPPPPVGRVSPAFPKPHEDPVDDNASRSSSASSRKKGIRALFGNGRKAMEEEAGVV